MRLPRGRRRVLAVAVPLLLIAGQSGALCAQDVADDARKRVQQALLRGERLELQAKGDAQMLNQFLPPLKKVLTVEMHFVHKVCRPDDDQRAEIQSAGEREVDSVARTFATLQKNDRNSRVLAAGVARQRISAALRESVTAVMPEETARSYQEELEARAAALQEAGAGMMSVVVDRQVSLRPEQFDQLSAASIENWDQEWSSNLQIYNYDAYAPIPPARVLQKVLEPRQQDLLLGQPRGTIHFGWEHEMRVFGMDLNVDELAEHPVAEEE